MSESLNIKLKEAETLAEEGRLGQAVDLLRQMTEEFPESAIVWHDLGTVYMTRLRDDLAVEELWEDHTDEESAMEGAIQAFEHALEANPGFVPALNNLGTLRAMRGQYREAIVLWERSLEENIDQPYVKEDLEMTRKEAERHSS